MPPNVLATIILGTTVVCATVLAALHVLPADVAGHMLSAALGGGLAYLSPQKAAP